MKRSEDVPSMGRVIALTPRARRRARVRLTVVPAPTPASAPEAGADAHVEAALELLARAHRSATVSGQGDALLLAIEHSARALGALFDAETARVHLARVIGRL